MSETDWKISKPAEQCQKCGGALGTPYYSALIQDQGGFQRKDFCAACFQNDRPAELFYYWKVAAVKDETPEKKRPAVDVENVLEFFKRLEGEPGTQKQAFRYILALMLARKKILMTGDRKQNERGQPVQVYREKGGGPEHSVVEPDLTTEEIQGMSAELGILLGTAT